MIERVLGKRMKSATEGEKSDYFSFDLIVFPSETGALRTGKQLPSNAASGIDSLSRAPYRDSAERQHVFCSIAQTLRSIDPRKLLRVREYPSVE